MKLIFDEVKTGCTISPAAPPQRFGVDPDMITLAKASCGGYPGGAIGMSEELAAIVADGTVKQYGTFNGNPLVMAAAEATLTEVLTDDVYERFEPTNRRLLDGCQAIVDSYGLPAYTEGLGAKGCVIFSPAADVRVPRLPERGRRRSLGPRLALPHEPRHLHDPGDRGGVDPLDRPLPTRTCSATSTPSRPSPATSPRAERRRDRYAASASSTSTGRPRW